MKLSTLCFSLALVAVPSAYAWSRHQGESQPGPGPEHAVLKQMVGSWTAEVHMGPGEPSHGTSEIKLDLGGMWLVSDFQSEMEGMSFRGHGITGYDTEKKKYVDCWVDSMTSSMVISEGSWDTTKKTLTMQGKSVDPVSGAPADMVNVTTFPAADTMKFEMHMGTIDAPPAMTIVYKRKK